MRDEDLLALIADHMEGGLLENIIDMFKHDPSLHRLLPGLISDERGRVRLGTAALVESLGEEHREEIASRVPALCELLAHDDPVVKGDVVYLLGAIGSEEALACLRTAAGKEHDPRIRELMEETVAEISGGPGA
ncbi:MAG: HEAT repeat domain-containing protein [Nitrospirota bacterium]|jgi:hypothetical protein